ncbi:MAG: hypothetical protein ABL883_14515 [Terricaulis sp.]
MSLNKTLDRLFDEIRREAKRNPDFADRMDAVLRAHESRRDVDEEVVAAVATPSWTAGVSPTNRRVTAKKTAGETPAVQGLNPAGLYKRDGEAALEAALCGQDLSGLRALVAEHNLDPAGETPALTRDELAAHILAQAKRRAERDEKLFEY